MKKNPLSPEQFSQLAAAVAELPFLKSNRWKTDYATDVLQTVLDFHMQSNVVENALNYFRDAVQQQQGLHSHQQLQAALASFPDTREGNNAASQFLWNNNHWQRVDYLRQLLVFFESIGVTDQASLYAWAKNAVFENDWQGKIKGLGIAVFHWLQIRTGVESAIKPDVHVINFAKRVVGKKLSEKALVQAFSEIAPLVGETLAAVDVSIWHWGKLSMATKDAVGLRLIAWNLLKAGLEEKLRAAVLSDFNWRVVLDDRHQLRYDDAGLTMLPDRSLFGETVPGETSVSIRQAVWSEALTLEIMIRHDTSLPLPLFKKLQACLAEDFWEAANDPHFVATLDFEEQMMIDPGMTIDDLAQWVQLMIERVMPSIRVSCSVNADNVVNN